MQHVAPHGTEVWQKERRWTGSHTGRSAGGRYEVPRDGLPAAMDDRVGWRKRAMVGSIEVDLVVVVVLISVLMIIILTHT